MLSVESIAFKNKQIRKMETGPNEICDQEKDIFEGKHKNKPTDKSEAHVDETDNNGNGPCNSSEKIDEAFKAEEETYKNELCKANDLSSQSDISSIRASVADTDGNYLNIL